MIGVSRFASLATVASALTAGAIAGERNGNLNSTVAADRSAEYATVQSAVDSLPKRDAQRNVRYVIHLKPGIYREKLVIPRDAPVITLVGEDVTSTILTFGDSADTPGPDGSKLGTFNSASTTVLSDDFLAENITFQNTHGAGSQAVAIHVAGDRAIFRRCRFLGWQDTVLLREGRHFFDHCFISGHVDFIFGDATAYFQSCRIHCLASGYITAASTPTDRSNGFVFAGCTITAERNVKTYLGRPWRLASSVAFLQTQMDEAVRPEGWHNWDDAAREKTARFAEHKSRGPGAMTEARVNWARQLSDEEAAELTGRKVLAGIDDWDPTAAPRGVAPGTTLGDGLTTERIDALPATEQAAWKSYLERSAEHLRRDQSTLASELAAAGLAAPLVPPAANDFKLGAKTPDWFASNEAQRLAENIVSFQTPSGGWSKAIAFGKGPRQPGMHWCSQSSWHYVGTFDNRATTEQLRLLAAVFHATNRTEFRDAFLKGLDYIYAAQFPTGGWPQVYPLEGGYHDAITFNDNSMVHILELLDDIARGQPELAFVPSPERVTAALTAGIDCILKSQISQGTQRTAWCAQHDPLTLAAVSARLKEPASLSGGESVAIVKFLMRNPKPSAEQVAAIKSALAWFERTKLIGLRPVEREGRSFWEQDPTSTQPVWARFYDVATNRPIFGGAQDGIVYDSFATMWRNNRFGYSFYVTSPSDLLTKAEQRWRKAISQ